MSPAGARPSSHDRAQQSRGRIAGRILPLSDRPAAVMQSAGRDSSATDSPLCSFTPPRFEPASNLNRADERPGLARNGADQSRRYTPKAVQAQTTRSSPQICYGIKIDPVCLCTGPSVRALVKLSKVKFVCCPRPCLTRPADANAASPCRHSISNLRTAASGQSPTPNC